VNATPSNWRRCNHGDSETRRRAWRVGIARKAI